MNFEVKNGCFGYKKKQILNDISFSVNDGEVMSVLGSNGVGKTTLIKCMIGLLKWKSGCSELDGTNISQLRHRELWQKIAYVPQAKGSAFSYSAIDMVTLGRSAHLGTFSQPGKEDRAAAERAMEDMGITYLHDKLCNEMSALYKQEKSAYQHDYAYDDRLGQRSKIAEYYCDCKYYGVDNVLSVHLKSSFFTFGLRYCPCLSVLLPY